MLQGAPPWMLLGYWICSWFVSFFILFFQLITIARFCVYLQNLFHKDLCQWWDRSGSSCYFEKGALCVLSFFLHFSGSLFVRGHQQNVSRQPSEYLGVRDTEKYVKVYKWKPFSENFIRLVDIIKEHFYCFWFSENIRK